MNRETRKSGCGHVVVGFLALLGSTSCAFSADFDGSAASDAQRSICGDATADWQDVEAYDGSLGPSVDFVDAHEGPVGKLVGTGCTGTLIDRDLVLTAGHCIPGNTQVTFNFQTGASGLTDTYDIVEVLEDDLGGVDYALVRIDGDAGDVWGTTKVAAFALSENQDISVIQHPSGLPKKVEGGTLGFREDGKLSYDDLDTLGGSSGSGVLQNGTGYLVGVHTNGVVDGECGPGDPNWAQPMTEIWEISPLFRVLAFDAAKLSAVL